MTPGSQDVDNICHSGQKDREDYRYVQTKPHACLDLAPSTEKIPGLGAIIEKLMDSISGEVTSRSTSLISDVLRSLRIHYIGGMGNVKSLLRVS